jgi:hypothetical protein
MEKIKGVWDVAQWSKTLPACVRSWVPLPATHTHTHDRRKEERVVRKSVNE